MKMNLTDTAHICVVESTEGTKYAHISFVFFEQLSFILHLTYQRGICFELSTGTVRSS